MRIRINPTRMQLLRLRQRLALARRGHKLLKDKLDGLVQQFFSVKNGYLELFNRLEPELVKLFTGSTLASSLSDRALIQRIAENGRLARVETEIKNIRGVRVPRYKLNTTGSLPEFSHLISSSELSLTLRRFSEILPELIELAGQSRSLELIARAIIETRRRVNALEYVLIPELERNLKNIRMKLAELEHSSQVVLLKIKDIVRSH